jgi:hypothetical protein
VQRYVDECLAGKTGPRDKDFNMRWVASLVAETFRILTRGGIFMYPKDSKDATKPGRLRLMYEANPISFIIEQAGGQSTTGSRTRHGNRRRPTLHQRVPLIFGSKNEVERVAGYHAEYTSGKEPETFNSPLFSPARCSGPNKQPTPGGSHVGQAPHRRHYRILRCRHVHGHQVLRPGLPPRKAQVPRSSRAIPSIATTASP